jgi:hypothetical protein
MTMKTPLLVAIGLVALAFAAAPAAVAEPGPCGPNVKYCQPFEPCRSPSNVVMQVVCGRDPTLPFAPDLPVLP